MTTPPSPKTMLITGATGFIGARLATLALQQGYQVKTLSRSDWDGLPAVPIQQRYFGNLPAQIPEKALRNVDVIVHCAAQVGDAPRSAHAINVEGTLRLAKLAGTYGAQTFIFISSQSAHPDAVSVYGKTKYAAEQQLLKLDNLNVIILRPGLVTGPGTRGLFQRMFRMVKTLPVLPLLAGGKAIVQPIYVDDLCAAIFNCCADAAALNKTILHLGDANGVSLADFLQIIAKTHLGRPKRAISIPLWPIEVVIKIAEILHIPLPINRNNLQGLKTVKKMDTAPDLSRLKLNPRPLDQMVQFTSNGKHQPLSVQERATRILLIGAGRVGLVHAVTLSRLNGVKLAGLVDPKAGATGLLTGMGISAPVFASLEEAVTATQPDAAVIATPVATHIPLTRACLQHNLAVLIEKPLAIGPEQLREYEQLLQQFPTGSLQVGYVLLCNPHIATCLERLQAGCFGKIQSFTGITLLAFIQETNTARWEVKKEISGGGALINAGGHVLSMIQAAFGDPQRVEAQCLNLFSTEVEDVVVVDFSYPHFSGRHYCSWSINGYPRQENSLIIQTDRGRLILTNSMSLFVPNAGQVEVIHQLDFEVGFNLAPDYAGSGFTTELTDLKEAAISRQPSQIDIKKAMQVEQLLFKIYDVSNPVSQFTMNNQPTPLVPEKPDVDISDAEAASDNFKRILDLRDLSLANTTAYLSNAATASNWDTYLLTPAQLKRVYSQVPVDQLKVTVPDFLNQSRLLASGRYKEVIKQMGLGGIVGAGFAALPLAMKERSPTFWVAATGLLGAGLKTIPAKFSGTILLHAYLVDFALSLRRYDLLETMLKLCRRTHPKARIGLHTNLAGEAIAALWLLETPVDEVSVLTAPNAVDMETRLFEMRRAGGRPLQITAEVGLAPAIAHQTAYQTPQRWLFGADAILIGPAADPFLAAQRQQEVAREWKKTFPGLELPEGIV